jgi:hypothetical protein
MRCVVLGVALLLARGPALAAADDKPDTKDLTPAEEYKALIADYQKEQEEFYKLVREAKSEEEQQKLYNEKMPKPDKVVSRLMELAEKNPKDGGVVPDALIWVVLNGGYDVQARKTKDKALDLLLGHAENEKVVAVCQNLVYSPSPKNEKFLRAVVEKSTKDEAKGKATYSLGSYLKKTADAATTLKEQPDLAKQYEAAYGEEIVKNLRESDPAALTKEAEKLFELIAEKYPAIKLYGEETLGELAKGELFEIRNLAIGQKAPEIEADDLDGKKFKLSDYRGKVVVIDFWGNW